MPSIPTRTLPARPDLDQLKRQAKELLKAFTSGDPAATAEVAAHEHRPDPASFALHDAQRVIARSYGFASWPKLKAFVDGVTVARLAEAVRAGDLARVEAMLKTRPELVHLDLAADNEHRAIHYAVLTRQPAMVRLLMAHGADARKGIYPHRAATTAYTLAVERGDDDIVRIIEAEEAKRGPEASASRPASAEPHDAHDARAAAARGDLAWLRARHAAGRLDHPHDGRGWLLATAVEHDRAEVLGWLLEHGFDPDERTRVPDLEEVELTWGLPLWLAARAGKHDMAAELLARGADPNGRVYASGSPVFAAYAQRDQRMIELLTAHGGRPDAVTVGLFGHVALAEGMMTGAIDPRLSEGTFAGETAAEQLLWGGACSGEVAIVRLALPHVGWPRDDARWYRILEQPLRMWKHGVNPEWNPDRYLEGFGLVLARADATLRGRFGRTLLHDVAAFSGRMTEAQSEGYARMLLDAGARLDVRDDLLRSTPLGWACRWGRAELVRLYLEHGADAVEADAESWATPRAWAEKRGHAPLLPLL